jgi:MFS family permease
MAACATCNALPSRTWLSDASSTFFATLAAMTFSASGAAPTPLYRQYQETFGLTPAMLTVIFAAYVLSLLMALLMTGSLSDYVGRRPVILTALAMNMVAMIMFATADSAAALIAARAVQGFATGIATPALGAAILDTDKSRGPVLNSVTAFAGLTSGSLGAGVLVTFAPDPTQLVYAVLLALSGIEIALLWSMPRTVEPKPGALASLRPHVSVPVQARRALAQLTPVNIAAWALGGFYFSLMPSVVRVATGVTSPAIGGLVVAALTFSAAMAVLLLRAMPAERMLLGGIPALAAGVAITLAGVQTQYVALMLLGTIVSGLGFGAAFSGTIRTLIPLAKVDERAGLLSAFYVEGYLAFSLPAVIAGVAAPLIGLATAAEIYGFLVILLAIASLLALVLMARR